MLHKADCVLVTDETYLTDSLALRDLSLAGEAPPPAPLERPQVWNAIRFGRGAALVHGDRSWGPSLEQVLEREWQGLGQVPRWTRVRRLVRRAWQTARVQRRR